MMIAFRLHRRPKRNFPPVPVKKSKLSVLRKIVPNKYSTRSQVDFKQVKLLEVSTSDPQAIGKRPSAWEEPSWLFIIALLFSLVL